jgi:hypothetical protein
MTVSVTASKTLTGSAIADVLTGGSSGHDLGESETGNLTPLTYPIFLTQNGTFEVTNFAVNVKGYSGTYGGDYSANSDLTKLLSHGDGGNGYQIDFRWDASTPFDSPFNYTVFKSGIGDTFPHRILIPVAAMSYNSTGTEVDASAPVAGTLGPIGSTTFGDRLHMNVRYVTPAAEVEAGRRQFDTYFTFNFTS